jgi:DNA-binding MurR/RpiR family transcriptional regulator
MASRIAQLTVIDCLVIGVAQRHLADSMKALDNTWGAVGSHRLETRHDGRRKTRETGK